MRSLLQVIGQNGVDLAFNLLGRDNSSMLGVMKKVMAAIPYLPSPQRTVKTIIYINKGIFNKYISIRVIKNINIIYMKCFFMALGFCFLGMLCPNIYAGPALNHYLYHQAQVEQGIAQQAIQQAPFLQAISGDQTARYAHYIKGLQRREQQRLPEPTHPIPHSVEFVSFSMPKRLLIQILRDAKIHHSPVVLRGLINNSFKTTAQTFFNLAKQHKGLGGIEIDPLWFRLFHIKQVPAFVEVTQPSLCSVHFCPSRAYYVVYGNIHIAQALAQITRAQRLQAMEGNHG